VSVPGSLEGARLRRFYVNLSPPSGCEYVCCIRLSLSLRIFGVSCILSPRVSKVRHMRAHPCPSSLAGRCSCRHLSLSLVDALFLDGLHGLSLSVDASSATLSSATQWSVTLSSVSLWERVDAPTS